MGRLAELWAIHRGLEDDDQKKRDVEKEINRIERWCIANNVGDFKTVTVFNSPGATYRCKNYPEESGSVAIEDFLTLISSPVGLSTC